MALKELIKRLPERIVTGVVERLMGVDKVIFEGEEVIICNNRKKRDNNVRIVQVPFPLNFDFEMLLKYLPEGEIVIKAKKVPPDQLLTIVINGESGFTSVREGEEEKFFLGGKSMRINFGRSGYRAKVICSEIGVPFSTGEEVFLEDDSIASVKCLLLSFSSAEIN
jgi:hypothetical protein